MRAGIFGVANETLKYQVNYLFEEKYLSCKNADGVMSCVYQFLSNLKQSNDTLSEVAFYCDNCGS